MAVSTTWVSNSGDWDSGASWNNGVPSILGGANPGVAIFDGSSVLSVTSGLVGATANRVITKQPYTGDIGSVGNPLVLESVLGIITHRGSGTVNVKGFAGDFLTVVIDSDNLINAAQIDGGLGRVWVKRGKATILPTAELTGSIGVVGEFGTLDVQARTAAEAEAPLVVVLAGNLIHDRGLAANGVIVVLGGRMEQLKALETVAGVEDRVIVGGGEFVYNPDTLQATNPLMIFGAGSSDLSQSEFAIAITAAVIGPQALLQGDILEDEPFLGTLTEPLDLRVDFP